MVKLIDQEVPCRDAKEYEFIQRTVDWQLYRKTSEDDWDRFALVSLMTNEEIEFNLEDIHEIQELIERASDIIELQTKTWREEEGFKN